MEGRTGTILQKDRHLMRILTFGLSAYTRGGIESFVLTFSKYLKGDIIFDYVFLEKENSIPEFEAYGSRLYHVSSDRIEPIKYCIDLFKLIRNNRSNIDAAYYHIYSTVHILPIVICRLMGLKVIVHAHNNSIPKRSFAYHILSNIGKFIIRHSKCLLLSNSDNSTAFLFGKDKVKNTEVIYNAIETEKYKYNAEVRNRVRKEFSVENKYVVGFSGRLLEQKNPLFVIDIFEKFHQIVPNCVLMMVGDGKLRPRVEARILEMGLSEDVLLLGMRSDMQDLYQAMDVFLLPSLFEGLGIVLVEAQAAGLPCLTSKDVIPSMVDVTELIHRESLSSPADVWAGRLNDMRQKAIEERDFYSSEVEKSMFNINTEAVRFGNIIKEYVG